MQSVDKQLILNYINGTGVRTSNYLWDLATLIEQYPFCQTLHLVYARELQGSKSVHTAQQIRISALHATDRAVLRFLLSKAQSVDDASESNSLIVTGLDPDVHIAHSPSKPAVSMEKPAEELLQMDVPSLIDEVIESSPVEDGAEVIGVSGVIPDEKPDKVILPSDEQLIDDPTQVVKTSRKQALLALIDQKLEELKAARQREEQSIRLALQSSTPENNVPDSLLKKESAKPFDVNDLLQMEALPPEMGKGEIQDKLGLIDKFLQEEPRLSKPRAGFFNQTEVAAHSNADQEEIVSETLAKVYIKQGNLAKAVKVFEKLSLKFPEKSSYFAAQIENLLNNSNKS